MSDAGYTVVSLARDVERINTRLDQKVSQREVDDVKKDVERLEDKLDRIIQTQVSSQRTALIQMAGIILTMLVAGYGALT